jgi:hypothetical protein
MSQDRGDLTRSAVARRDAKRAEIEQMYRDECLATDLAHDAVFNEARDALERAAVACREARARPAPDHKEEIARRDQRIAEAVRAYDEEMQAIFDRFGIGDRR